MYDNIFINNALDTVMTRCAAENASTALQYMAYGDKGGTPLLIPIELPVNVSRLLLTGNEDEERYIMRMCIEVLFSISGIDADEDYFYYVLREEFDGDEVYVELVNKIQQTNLFRHLQSVLEFMLKQIDSLTNGTYRGVYFVGWKNCPFGKYTSKEFTVMNVITI